MTLVKRMGIPHLPNCYLRWKDKPECRSNNTPQAYLGTPNDAQTEGSLPEYSNGRESGLRNHTVEVQIFSRAFQITGFEIEKQNT